MRARAVVALLLLLSEACGGGRMTLSDYADEADGIVSSMDRRLDAEAAEYFAADASVEATRAYLAVRVESYAELLEGLKSLSPPKEVEDLHTAFVDLIGELLAAEKARAERAAAIETVDEIDRVWNDTESAAVQALEAKAVELCTAAQRRFDATKEREAFAGNYWIPDELSQVVRVALDCPSSG